MGKLCDTCIYRDNTEYFKPCVIYRNDCEFYEKEKDGTADDLISRQAVIDRKYVVEVKNMWHMTEEIEVVNVDDIKALPPVNPQEPKTGHWIKTISENGITSAVRCSECGFEDNRYMLFRYCPNCGAKMVEPQESEE